MTNEWQEFKAYTGKPTYSAENKHDLSYLGRFTFRTITDYEGLGRILTIIARGYFLCKIKNKQKIRTRFLFGKLGSDFSGLVRATGLEPVRCHHRGILSPLRLPISPRPHINNDRRRLFRRLLLYCIIRCLSTNLCSYASIPNGSS